MESIVIEYHPKEFPALQSAVMNAIKDGASRVVLNLDTLESLDNEGVRGLITLLRRSREAGGELALHSSKPDVRRTLAVTALDRLFPMVEPEAA